MYYKCLTMLIQHLNLTKDDFMGIQFQILHRVHHGEGLRVLYSPQIDRYSTSLFTVTHNFVSFHFKTF